MELDASSSGNGFDQSRVAEPTELAEAATEGLETRLREVTAELEQVKQELARETARRTASEAELEAIGGRLTDPQLAEAALKESHRQRAEQDLRQRLDQLQAIYQLADAVGQARAPELIYAEALNGLERTLGADRASILLVDSDGAMRFEAWRGLSDRYRQATTGHSPWSPNAKDRVPITVEDVESEPGLESLRDVIRAEGIRSLGFFPLTAHGRLLGKFMVYFDRPHRFTPGEVRLAQTIARHIAFAIERSRTEAELRESAGRLRLALAAGRMGIWDWDIATGGLAWTEEVERIHGLQAGEFGGNYESFIKLVHPDDRERVSQTIARAVEERDSDFHVEFRVVWPDGSLHWIAGEGQVFCDEAGQPVRMLGVGLDITPRKQAEIELRQSREQLDVILRGVSDGITVQDSTGRLIFANDAAARLSGYPDAQSLMRTSPFELTRRFEIWNENGQPVAIQDLPGRHVLRAEVGPERILRFRIRATGAERWSSVRASPVFDERGRVRLAINVFHDITALKQAEARLREQAETLETLNRIGQLLSAELNLDRLVQAVTDAATQLSGAKYGAFFYNAVDEGGEHYTLYTLSGISREAFANLPMPGNTPLFSTTFRGEAIVRLDDVRRDPRYGKTPQHHGLPSGHVPVVSYLAVPVVARSGEPIGGLFLGHPEPGVFGEREERLVVGLAAQIAVAVDNARLFESERQARKEAEAAQKRLSLLAEASALLTSSLDYEMTLSRVAQLAVPALADWCFLDMLDADGHIRRAEVAHADPAQAGLAQEAFAYPPGTQLEGPAAQVLRSGKALLVPEVTDAVLEAAAHDADHLRHLRAFQAGSFIIVPLIARERTLGLLTFVTAQSNRRYGADDRALAEELGRRAAVAVDNALLYREAQQAIRLRERFLSIASHELRTPMTVLNGYAEGLSRLIQKNAATGSTPTVVTLERARVVNALERIERACARLTGLTEELLDVARLQSGTLSLSPEPTNLSALLADVVEGFIGQQQAGRYPASISLRVDAPPEEPGVWGSWDRSRLEQVMVNLIDNAFKYSPPHGLVHVALCVEEVGEARDADGGPFGFSPPVGDAQSPTSGRVAHLIVADQGIGIPPDQQERIFEPFSRATNASERNFPGLGMGLAISKEIVSRHAGKIWVESAGADCGSRFHVTLRMETDEAS